LNFEFLQKSWKSENNLNVLLSANLFSLWKCYTNFNSTLYPIIRMFAVLSASALLTAFLYVYITLWKYKYKITCLMIHISVVYYTLKQTVHPLTWLGMSKLCRTDYKIYCSYISYKEPDNLDHVQLVKVPIILICIEYLIKKHEVCRTF
jgi:hypothetical protein